MLQGIKIETCAPRKIIIGDITYIALQNGSWCYLAVWQDKVTRRVSGWSLSETMTAELVISALEKAIGKGLVSAGAIIHSDGGSQYGSNGFRELLRQSGFRQSMSGKGNCYDNGLGLRVSFRGSKPNSSKAEHLKTLNKRGWKSSAILKALTIGSD